MRDRLKPEMSGQPLILVTSIFVLGFVVGPLLWAPLGEVMGRR
jgi:MFS family permease